MLVALLMKKVITKLNILLLAATITGGSILSAQAQTMRPMPPEPPTPRAPVAPIEEDLERSMQVAPNVNLSVCVNEGRVSVNGWRRNEVRVYVKDGSRFDFSVRDTDASGRAVWLKLTSPTGKPGHAGSTDCLRAGVIEIDVPIGAVVGVTGREAVTRIDSVRKASVKTIGGEINLRNITDGVSAKTGQGHVIVENVGGPIELESTTGNIIVVETNPKEIGDSFRARTHGGTISLQRLQHRQLDVGSISGSVLFDGNIRSGGSYSLSTTRGSIKLIIPQASSCNINAVYAYGTFSSEIPMQVLTENKAPGSVKTVNALMGKGDALLKLTTNNGNILIAKQ